MAFAVLLSGTACNTLQDGDSGTKQALINYGAKAAVTASAFAFLKNNEGYADALAVVSSELAKASWNEEITTSGQVVELIRNRLVEEQVIDTDRQEKILFIIAAGLGIYDEYMRANDFEVIGQNSVLSALSDGIDRALLAKYVFDDNSPEDEPNPFTL